MDVAFSDLKRTFELYSSEYEDAALRALRNGWYIMGSELEAFESEFADYIGVKRCVGVGSGLSALTIALRALGVSVGDEVIVQGNTFIATVLAVVENGATPVFIDCNEYFQVETSEIEEAITPKTKAVIVTNLYGQAGNLQEARRICDKHDLVMLEDCAQSHGSHWDKRMSGTYADVSCFSFYPTKPLGAMGDGGACLTDSDEISETILMLRNYGSREKYVNEICGYNSRLDELQASLLRVGLSHIEEMRELREAVAQRYLEEIKNPAVKLPETSLRADNVWHVFPILCDERDRLKSYLESRGIHTQIHYPTPPHKAQCFYDRDYKELSLPNVEYYAASELSLPIYAGMPQNDVEAVVNAVNSFR